MCHVFILVETLTEYFKPKQENSQWFATNKFEVMPTNSLERQMINKIETNYKWKISKMFTVVE